MTLNHQQLAIHNRALALAKAQRKIESDLIKVLHAVDRSKLFKKLDCPSLFVYATRVLELTESVAYALIAVARKSAEIPELARAIEAKEISVFKAVRITSAIDEKNATKLIEFAKSHSSKEIDFEVAKLKPDIMKRACARVVAANRVELKVTVSKNAYENLLRVQSLLAQKQKSSNLEDAVMAGVESYLWRHDPVKKAERANARKVKKMSFITTITDGNAHVSVSEEPGDEAPHNATAPVILHEAIVPSEPKDLIPIKPCSSKVLNTRVPLTVEQKHAVFLRDGGRCTHQGRSNIRCNSDKWIDIHHIIPVSLGGTNDIDNLTTLCSFHHDLVHQLSLPIDGQVNWLRSPTTPYCVV